MIEPLLIRALKGNRTDRIPFWYMRQAGRYLPEYNQVRSGRTFIELMENADLSFEVSMQPYRRFKMDGIIMFSDILTPARAAGVPLHFEEKKGPVIEHKIENEKDLAMLDGYTDEKVSYVAQILTRLREAVAHETDCPGVIGFAGSPFTVASYLIEGGSTQKFETTKSFLFGRNAFFDRLATRLTDITIQYLDLQIRSGAQAVQIFDSWGGILSADHYTEFSAQYSTKIIQEIRRKHPTIPVILFVGNSSHLISRMVEQKPDAISLDWRVTSDEDIQKIPETISVQGNLDPLTLYGSVERTKLETQRVLNRFKNRSGYVFNLGHGIHPSSPIANVQAMIDEVRSFRR